VARLGGLFFEVYSNRPKIVRAILWELHTRVAGCTDKAKIRFGIYKKTAIGSEMVRSPQRVAEILVGREKISYYAGETCAF
jgi:hypothetical protein